MPHDRKHLLTSAITAEYRPNQPCPEIFLKFVNLAFGLEQLDAIRAYTSMLLDPTAPYGFFIHLMGPSGSGKGTLLRLWGEMFSLENFRSGDFSNLGTAETRHQYLTSAALFVVPDVGGYIQGLKAFYELVDNGPMTGRTLFSSNGYQKKWDTRYVVASVDYLQIENSGDGWDRRCRPLITKARRGIEDPDLGSKLANIKSEIISWALAMPREERDRLLLCPSSNEQIQQHKLEAAIHGDPVRGFLDLCFRPCEKAVPIHTHQLHSWFKEFAETHGYQGWGMSKLAAHLKTILPTHFVQRRRATTHEDPMRRIIPGYWSNMSPLFGVFVNISESSLANNRSNNAPPEPAWKCIKANCREGGLLAFQEFNKSRDGSGGSGTLPDLPKVPDLLENIAQQELSKNGSGGSDGSGGGVSKLGEEILIEKPNSLNNSSVNSCTFTPSPIPDLPDLPDPWAETPAIPCSLPDQAVEQVPDPSKQVPDPSPIRFKVGDVVAHSNSYMVSAGYHGIVEEVNTDGVLVRWRERYGKPFELERYEFHELRLLERKQGSED